ncbi:MAG: hypothetical protein KDH96_13080 [Candidatus Riesia sp.]|nr:hypothetical protein [Candidatus Riesia sp.]
MDCLYQQITIFIKDVIHISNDIDDFMRSVDVLSSESDIWWIEFVNVYLKHEHLSRLRKFSANYRLIFDSVEFDDDMILSYGYLNLIYLNRINRVCFKNMDFSFSYILTNSIKQMTIIDCTNVINFSAPMSVTQSFIYGTDIRPELFLTADESFCEVSYELYHHTDDIIYDPETLAKNGITYKEGTDHKKSIIYTKKNVV